MHSHLRRVRGQVVQRCSHPGVVRPPEDSMPSPGFVVLSVPCVGEEVLTIHSWYLRVVAVGAQRPSPHDGPRQHCAGNARLHAAPNRYLAAGSTAGSCLLESADDGTASAKDYPDQVADTRAAVCDQGFSLGQRSGMSPDGRVRTTARMTGVKSIARARSTPRALPASGPAPRAARPLAAAGQSNAAARLGRYRAPTRPAPRSTVSGPRSCRVRATLRPVAAHPDRASP